MDWFGSFQKITTLQNYNFKRKWSQDEKNLTVV